MKHRHMLSSLPLLALFLALSPTALASSTWYVDGVNGSDNNDCKSPQTACATIGHAISLASSGDSIMVAAATYTENLTIGRSLKIVGSGATTTIIDGGGVNTVVTIYARVTVSKVTIRNGINGQKGGGIYNSGSLTINESIVTQNAAFANCPGGCGPEGGGIYNSGKLTINKSTLSGNFAYSAGCRPHKFCFGSGAGLFNATGGTLTINKSTLSGNRAKVWGGGILNVGTLAISNSTLSGNDAPQGGGIWNWDATLTISNSTLSGNVAAGSGGGITTDGGTLTINNSTLSGNGAGDGGGIHNVNAGKVALQNSIVANNSGGNCAGTMTSNGYNLSSDYTCEFNGTGDLNSTDPKLGKLGYHGGPTQTIPLLPASPAIDAGNPSGCTDGQGHLLKTDQRGKPRPDKEDTGGCDMGAYERQKD